MVKSSEEVVDIYRKYSTLPTISYARLSNTETAGHVKVQSCWTQRDLERKENIQFCRTHIVQLDFAFGTPPTEVNNEQWCKESPSGKFRAIVRTLKDKKDEEKQYIDVWEETRKIRTICITDLEQHGKIYEADGLFGTFQWNEAETHLLYVAEKKAAKSKSFFDKKKISETDDKEDVRGEEFDFKDFWGEQCVDKRQPVVCIMDIETGIPSVLENIPDDVSAAQAIWSPDDMGVVCVGYYHDPYRLGIIYCPIRKSALFYIDLKTSHCTMLGDNNKAVRCPVFSPDKTKLVYLENEIGGPHMQCSVLKMIDWPTKGIVTVVERVHKATGPDFPGIYGGYGYALNERCWSRDSKRVLLNTFWRSKQELIVIETETGDVRRITDDPSIGFWSLLDVKNDIVVAVRSSPNSPEQLVIAHLPESGKEISISWKALDEQICFKGVSWKIVKMNVPDDKKNPKYDYLDYECILIEPVRKDDRSEKPPLVVFPHGGPHSVIPATFFLSSALLCKAGYAVAAINYRGSVGFGQGSIDSLPGHIGSQDVIDCQNALETIISMGTIDKDKVVVYGGSHGGFLTAHLIGQFPNAYKAAVARNPVINIASMVNSSDIPDWTFVEAGLEFDQRKTSSAEIYSKMWNMSPIRYIDNVKAPVLILLGQDDLRVSPKQGEEYYKSLRALGKTTRCLSYPGNNHPIAKVDAEADAFINMIKWFNTHLGYE